VSSRPCGCDPEANHRCEWHQHLLDGLTQARGDMLNRLLQTNQYQPDRLYIVHDGGIDESEEAEVGSSRS
jgi:hypothetical protein